MLQSVALPPVSMVWLPLSIEHKLPLIVRYKFIIKTDPHDIIGIFSKQCGEWGSGSDGLTWHVATHRDDLTFRTQIYGSSTTSEKHATTYKMEVGKQYDAEVRITKDWACFYLNGAKYYSCVLNPGDVEEQGKIGFSSCSNGASVIFDID
jgi:hypothetical protein